LASLFADMPEQLRRDLLLPLLRGNLAHVRAIRASQLPQEVQYREWVLCVRRGFDSNSTRLVTILPATQPVRAGTKALERAMLRQSSSFASARPVSTTAEFHAAWLAAATTMSASGRTHGLTTHQ
jgi:hypothetical protein